MNPIVKKDILNLLRLSIAAIKEGNLFKLRELSDQVIHNAAIFQDKDSITIAILIYSISKIFKDNVDDYVLDYLESGVTNLEIGKINAYESDIKSIMKTMESKNGNTKYYVQEVFEMAEIKKASKIFEHGISMAQVADSLGISLWDLMDYVGKTRIIDNMEQGNGIKARLSFTRGLFR
ncbi:MAG: hypothetical protein NDI94_03015 [Candidatus Woesearchaeota archaeon]|nr:hypothetical protein [Candidatus Woesearchaeota archaeon]